MKNVIVLVFAIIIGIGSAIAQNETNLEKLQNQVLTAEKSFQDYFDSDRSLKSLKESVKNNVKKRHENVKTALEAIIKTQQDQLLAYQDELSVFRFFSNTEETVFADSTLERNGWSKKLTGTYLTQYVTIASIRDASSSISEVESAINKMTDQQQEKGWDNEQLRTAIALEIGNKMRTSIAKQLDDIDKMDLSFLSPAQKEYYRELSGRFDKIFNTYF